MHFKHPILHHIFETAITFLYPAQCKVCEETIGLESVSYLCKTCWNDLRIVEPPWCEICGNPSTDEVCSQCATNPPRYGKLRTVAMYDAILQKVVHLYKFEGRITLAKHLIELMIENMPYDCNISEYDYILPIPIHKKRLRERGFNQSKLLAQGIAQVNRVDILTDALVRSRNTSPQSSLARDERQTNIIGAFEVKNSEEIRGKRILILDDVFTTGATIREAVNVLWDVDPEEIDVLTLARTLTPE